MAPASERLKTVARGGLQRAGLLEPARSLWHRRPRNRARRRFQAWLSEADRRDGERMRLVMATVLSRDSNVVDIGAAEGDFTLEAVRLAPQGRHIAYEPLSDLFQTLTRKCPGVDARNAAVSDRAGDSTFIRVDNAPAWSGLERYAPGTMGAPTETEVPITTVRLDDDLPEGYVPHLIKIDVNGAEGRVLEGALQTISDHRPIVLLEHGRAAQAYGTSAADVHELLHGRCGLEIFDLEGNGPLSSSGFAREAESKWNWVVRPY